MKNVSLRASCRSGVELGALVAILMSGMTSAPARALEATRALSAGLVRTGRAEATLSWSVPAPPGRAAAALRGVLAIEPPELARLDIAATGERITLRADGGEWLQPQLQQFVKLDARHSVAAMRWWRLLAGVKPATGARTASAGSAPGTTVWSSPRPPGPKRTAPTCGSTPAGCRTGWNWRTAWAGVPCTGCPVGGSCARRAWRRSS